MNNKIIYLSIEQVLAIHDQMVKRFGGSHGIREIGLIESAVKRPQATFDENDLYVDIFEKAAALFHSLLKNHPFVDGNKRTALTSTGIFLKLNGYLLKNSHQEEIEFSLKIATESLSVKEIAEWLINNSTKI